MKARRLALNAERLTELSADELRAVNGGVTFQNNCAAFTDPSDFFISVCECLTRNCITSNCA